MRKEKNLKELIVMTIIAISAWLFFQEELSLNISFFSHSFSAYVMAKWVERGSSYFEFSEEKEVILKYIVFFIGAAIWETFEWLYFKNSYVFFSLEIVNDTKDNFFDLLYGILGTTLSLKI